MALVASVDYTARRIYLTVEALTGDFDTLDVYREVRALRRTVEAHRRFLPMIVGAGNIQKTATTFTQAYVQLLYGCRLIPHNTTGRIKMVRDTFTDDGVSGADCFDRSGIAANVDIDVAVQAVEIRTVSTGGGGSNPDIENSIQRILDLAEADEEMTPTSAVKRHRTTKQPLLEKTVSGGRMPASPVRLEE